MENTALNKDFIISEVRKLQYLYGLKKEIRYGQTRPTDLFDESVAEHIYGMHICAQYFLPLEDPENKLNHTRIYQIITVHDIDEIETGDMIGYLKTDAIRQNEAMAAKRVIANSPAHMQKSFTDALDEYEKQETKEAKFIKAIDRFEPLVQIYNDFGHFLLAKNKTKQEDSRRIKEDYIKPFPTMFAYYEVIHQAMIDEGYFTHQE